MMSEMLYLMVLLLMVLFLGKLSSETIWKMMIQAVMFLSLLTQSFSVNMYKMVLLVQLL